MIHNSIFFSYFIFNFLLFRLSFLPWSLFRVFRDILTPLLKRLAHLLQRCSCRVICRDLSWQSVGSGGNWVWIRLSRPLIEIKFDKILFDDFRVESIQSDFNLLKANSTRFPDGEIWFLWVIWKTFLIIFNIT